MKKLILSLMLLIGSLSFSNDRDRGRENSSFEDLKLRAEVSYNEEQMMLNNVFDYNGSLSNDSDNEKEDYFEDLKLKGETIHKQKQEQNSSPRKPDENPTVKISNIFNNFKSQKIEN